MKNGLIFENGELFYYVDDVPFHAGIVQDGDNIYYIGSGGKAVKGVKVVHRSMSNHILSHGTYTFGDDYKLVEGSYIAPKKLKRSRKKNKKNKNLYVVYSAIFSAVALCFLILLAINFNVFEKQFAHSETHYSSDEISLPKFDSEVLLCSEGAKNLFDKKTNIEQAETTGNPYRHFVFKYSLNGADGKLFLSENEDLSKATEYTLLSSQKSIVIDNLKTGTQYYYEVKVGQDVYFGGFKTAKSTRYIYMPGVYNTRDIGGYTTLDGKTVKQGKIIRGTEIDGLVEYKYFLADEHIEKVSNELSFVYDMDLRDSISFESDYKSRLGENVGHRFYNAPAYSAIFNTSYKKSIKNVFSDLANPKNYPMYMHCTYGADRTGTIVFLLQGILNVPQEDMLVEYQQTAFADKNYINLDKIKVLQAGLDQYNGDTINQKIENFLIEDIGVTRQEIQSIRDILLEP